MLRHPIFIRRTKTTAPTNPQGETVKRTTRDARLVTNYGHNILAIYLDADDATRAAGAVWYSEEAARCEDFARRYKRPAHCIAGAAAAISPGLRWETTFSYLAALMKDHHASVPTYSREFVRRAVFCLMGGEPMAVLSGPKVTAFYKLLARQDADAVVIDGHALNIARGRYDVFRHRADYRPPASVRVTARRYRCAAAAYREVADVVGAPAHAVQAATWLHWRNLTRPQRRNPGED